MIVVQQLHDNGQRLARLALGQLLTEGRPRRGNVTRAWLVDFLGRWKVWRWAANEKEELQIIANNLPTKLETITEFDFVGKEITRAGTQLQFPQKFSALSKIACAYYPDRVFVQDRFARAGLGLPSNASYANLVEAASFLFNTHLSYLDQTIDQCGIVPALAPS